MQRPIIRARLPWEDRFRRPSAEDLLAPYARPVALLVEAARERLSAFEGLTEEISWQGIPWRWAFVYREPDNGPRGWAYLVPDPARPQIALPLVPEVVETLRVRRLSRFIRDRIIYASKVGDVRWAQWDIASRNQLDEVLDLAACKHNVLAATA